MRMERDAVAQDGINVFEGPAAVMLWIESDGSRQLWKAIVSRSHRCCVEIRLTDS
jgi:hypothetical protein